MKFYIDKETKNLNNKKDINATQRFIVWLKGRIIWSKDHPFFTGAGAFIIFISFLLLVKTDFFGSFNEQKRVESIRDSILLEINIARNKLDYTLTQRSLNVGSRTEYSFEHSGKVSDVFPDEPDLRDNLKIVYDALANARTSASELKTLLSQKGSDHETIENRENDIIRAIREADITGQKLAVFLGKEWLKPPENLAGKARIKWFRNKTTIITSVATDSEVRLEFHKQ